MIAMKLLTSHPDRVSSAVIGGMGWLKNRQPLSALLGSHQGYGNPSVPAACLRGIAKLA